MSYTINTTMGTVTRDADGVVVSPAQSATDPDFLAYLEWASAGNKPKEVSTPPAPQVPRTVTMRQARLALLGAGLLGKVDAAIDSLPEPPRSAARIEWEYSTEVHRDREFVSLLAGGLGLTNAQLDALFVTAAGL